MSLKHLEGYFKRVFLCGTHMGLIDKDSVVSAIGKEDSITVHYTKEAKKEDHIEILKYFLNLNDINMDELDDYLLTGKKRLTANAIRFLDIKTSKNKTEILKNSLQKSYEKTKDHLLQRIHKFIENSNEETKKRINLCKFFLHN